MSTLGVLKAGTVGVMGSGRLVLVQQADRTSARLVALPDQPAVLDDFYTNLITGQLAFPASPFIKIEPVDPATLSERNRHFIETGVVLPGAVQQVSAKKTTRAAVRENQRLVRASDACVVVKYPQYHAQFQTVFNIVSSLTSATEEQVIQQGKAQGLWAGRSGQDKALHWCVVQLVKAGCLKWE